MVLIAMAGMPASGKSVLAKELAQALPALVLDKDQVRAALFPPDEIEYSLQQDDFTFGIVLQVAGYLLRKGRNIILDGRPFAHRHQMDAVVRFASQYQFPLKVIECTCSEESFRLRHAQDSASKQHLAANRSYEMFLAMRAKADPLVVPRLVVDTDQSLADCVSRSLEYVNRSPEFAA
jgi:predicted kinase